MSWAKAVLTTLRLPHLGARLRLTQDLRAFIRVHFLFSAQRLGLLAALSSPATEEELAHRLEVERAGLFRLLLDLGVSLGELGRDGERYVLKGSRSRALAGRDREILEGLLEEVVLYDASVYRDLPERVTGAPLGDYLKEMGTLVARASRVFEPFVRGYVREVVMPMSAPRVLDVGCGSGVYLHEVAGARPDATGLGIDLHDEVVEMAQLNVRRWGVADRFAVSRADIREGTASLGGPFDLIFLLNNVYYFSPEERPALFLDLRSALTDRGTLVVISMLHGSTLGALHLDLVLGSTVGCYPLPHLEPLAAQLAEAGFGDVRTDRLIPRESYFAIRAR
jgi:4-hydroxy-2,2'-bipyrrole-5-carbaldehyde O-methyltransferase